MHICVMFNMWLYFPTTIDNTQQTNCHTCLAVALLLLVTNISIPYSLGSRRSHLAVYLSTCSAWVSAHLFASLPGPACLAIQLGPLSVTSPILHMHALRTDHKLNVLILNPLTPKC